MSEPIRITGRQAMVARMETTGLVAILRSNSPDRMADACEALVQGGVDVAEITMTTPGALAAIEATANRLGDQCLLGVGSVLDAHTARLAILAGAQFIVSPTVNLEVIQMANRYGKPVLPGAMTPTEIMTAFEAGADMVKVFPANYFGPGYLKDVLAPMPQLKLMPTGGVNLQTVSAWIDAGACCLGVATSLVRKEMLEAGDWKGLTQVAQQFIEAVKAARAKK